MSCLAAVGLALAWTAGVAHAQLVTIYPDNLNNGNTAVWNLSAWGGQSGGSSIDTGTFNSPASSSVHVVDNLGGGDQAVILSLWAGSWWNGTATTNLLLFTNVVYDVLWDPAYSTIEIPAFNSTPGDKWQTWAVGNGFAWITLGQNDIPVAASNGWVTVTTPINPLTSGIDQVMGLGFKKWTGTGQTGYAGFWISNIGLQYEGTPPPPPTMNNLTTQPVIQGLNLYDDSGQYDRQSIATVVTNVSPHDFYYGWYESATPVTYSYTLAAMPTNNGYQTHIMIMPGNNVQDIAPDWNQANAIVWFVNRQADGSVIGALRYKLGNANNNNYLFGSDTAIFGGPGYPFTNTIVAGYGGLLGSVTNTGSPLGTWSLTFSDKTNILLSAPDGHTTTCFFPQDADAQVFNTGVPSTGGDPGPVTIYWGAQPNTANLSKDVIMTHVGISGGSSTLSADLTQPLDPTKLSTRYSNGQIVFRTPADAVYWLQWSLPDVNYVLQKASSPVGPWTTVGNLVNNTIYTNDFSSSGTITPGVGWTDGSSGATLASSWDSGAQAEQLTYTLYSTPSVVSSLNAQLNVPPSSPDITAIDMDIKVVSAGSTTDAYGGYGYFTLMVQSGSGYTPYDLYSNELGSYGLACVDTWQHIHVDVSGAAASQVKNVDLQIYSDTGRAINGNVIIQIDNLGITQAGLVPKTPYTVGGKHSVYINAGDLPSSGAGYYRLARPY